MKKGERDYLLFIGGERKERQNRPSLAAKKKNPKRTVIKSEKKK